MASNSRASSSASTVGDIGDEQILHVGGAQFARGEAVRKVGGDA